jgi:hypothetical protein
MPQAMVFILSACADQAELINRNLPAASYQIFDLLPGSDDDLAKESYMRHFSDGGKVTLSRLSHHRNSSLFNVLDDVVWKTAITPFGPVVGPIVVSISQVLLSFYYSFSIQL